MYSYKQSALGSLTALDEPQSCTNLMDFVCKFLACSTLPFYLKHRFLVCSLVWLPSLRLLIPCMSLGKWVTWMRREWFFMMVALPKHMKSLVLVAAS